MELPPELSDAYAATEEEIKETIKKELAQKVAHYFKALPRIQKEILVEDGNPL